MLKEPTIHIVNFVVIILKSNVHGAEIPILFPISFLNSTSSTPNIQSQYSMEVNDTNSNQPEGCNNLTRGLGVSRNDSQQPTWYRKRETEFVPFIFQ